MSAPRFARPARRLREALSSCAWIQWQALGAQAAAPRAPASIVDPEALVLASLWLADGEPRLRDFLAGVAAANTRLLSAQRLKRAMAVFPPGTDRRVADFAAAAAGSGRDSRWARLAIPGKAPSARRGKVAPVTDRLRDPGSLLLRLRTAFGVDLRADVLGLLLGRQDDWVDVRELSDALCFASYSVRLAADSLVDAGLVASHGARPVRFRVEAAPWLALLGVRGLPRWRPWVSVYAFALELGSFLSAPRLSTASRRLAASLAREFLGERHEVLAKTGIGVPQPRGRLNEEEYLPSFERVVEGLADWMEGAV